MRTNTHAHTHARTHKHAHGRTNKQAIKQTNATRTERSAALMKEVKIMTITHNAKHECGIPRNQARSRSEQETLEFGNRTQNHQGTRIECWKNNSTTRNSTESSFNDTREYKNKGEETWLTKSERGGRLRQEIPQSRQMFVTETFLPHPGKWRSASRSVHEGQPRKQPKQVRKAPITVRSP